MSVAVEPILDDDVCAVADFLRRELNPRLGVDGWVRAIRTSFDTSAPHHGLVLRDGHDVLAVLLTFFSERTIGARQERFCNLGAWCARPDQRFQGLRLLRTALKLPGYHFTDLSPSGSVVPLNEKLGFHHLDTSSSVLPCVPRPSRCTVLTEPDEVIANLQPQELAIYAGHREAAAAHHVVLRDGDANCYVMFRLERRKDLRVFASVLYVSDRGLFQRMAPAFATHVFLRYRTLALILEHRITGERPGTIPLRTPRPKMFKSSTLVPADIDNLYSELCAVPW